MAPKQRNVPAAAAPGISAPAVPPTNLQSQSSNPFTILSILSQKYVANTPSRTKLIDAFLVFLMAVGVLQFVYCVVAGNYVSSPGCLVSTSPTRGQDGLVGKRKN